MIPIRRWNFGDYSRTDFVKILQMVFTQDPPNLANRFRSPMNICVSRRNVVLAFNSRMSSTSDSNDTVAPAISDGKAAIANNGVHLHVTVDRQAVERLK